MKAFLPFLLILFILNCKSQTTFHKKYITGNSYSHGLGVVVLEDSSIIMTIQDSSLMLIKTDSTGTPVWSKNFAINPMRDYDHTNSATKLVRISDGNLLFAGMNLTASYLLKTDTAGNIIWNKKFNGEILSFHQTRDHGFIVAVVGHDSLVGPTRFRNQVLKLDSTGMLQWGKMYEKIHLGTNMDVIETDDHGFIFYSDSILAKLDSTGNLLRAFNIHFQIYNGSLDFERINSNCYLLSLAYHTLFSIDSTSHVIWHKEMDPGPFEIIRINDSTAMLSGPYFSGAWPGIYTLKLNTSGNELDLAYFNIQEFISATSCVPYGDGSFIITGYFHSSDIWNPYDVPLLIKTDSNAASSCGNFNQLSTYPFTMDSITSLQFSSIDILPILTSDSIFIASTTLPFEASICSPLTYVDSRTNQPSEFQVYPNPATNEFVINNNQNTSGTIEIFSPFGEKIYSATYNFQPQTLNLKLYPGIYFVRLSDSEKQLTKKLVIE